MIELKCPFCQQELRKIHPTYVICDNCRITGEDKLWQELMRTRRALDVAVDALKLISLRYLCEYADKALEQITALEQNDHFADVSKKVEQKDVK